MILLMTILFDYGEFDDTSDDDADADDAADDGGSAVNRMSLIRADPNAISQVTLTLPFHKPF